MIHFPHCQSRGYFSVNSSFSKNLAPSYFWASRISIRLFAWSARHIPAVRITFRNSIGVKSHGFQARAAFLRQGVSNHFSKPQRPSHPERRGIQLAVRVSFALQDAASRNFQGVAVVIGPRYRLSSRDDAYQPPLFLQTNREFVPARGRIVAVVAQDKLLRFPQCDRAYLRVQIISTPRQKTISVRLSLCFGGGIFERLSISESWK